MKHISVTLTVDEAEEIANHLRGVISSDCYCDDHSDTHSVLLGWQRTRGTYVEKGPENEKAFRRACLEANDDAASALAKLTMAMSSQRKHGGSR